MVGTRSLSSGAHSRDPVALPTLRQIVVSMALRERLKRAHDEAFR